MKHIVIYFMIVTLVVSFVITIGCGMIAASYGVVGNVYDYNTSNAISGMQIRLYDSHLSDSTRSASNGYYSIAFVYDVPKNAGCSTVQSFPEEDKKQDFTIEVSDTDGASNGSYQNFTTNIGTIYSPDSCYVMKGVDIYIMTN